MNAREILMAAIGNGEGRAVRSKQLQALTGLSERELRKCIETLRREGVPIISSGKGYYLPVDLTELDRFIAKESKRAKSVLFTLREVKRYRRQLALDQEFEPISRLDER